MLNLKKEAIRGAKWTTITSVISILVGLVQWGIIGRYISSEEIGTFSMMSVVVGLATIFSDAGISNGLIHFQNLTNRQLNTLYWINVFAAGVTYIFLYLFAPLLTSFLFDNATDSNQIITYIRIFGLTIIILPLGQQFQYLLQKELQFDKLAYVDFAHKATIFLSFIILLMLYNMGFMAVIYSYVCGALVNTFILFLLGIKQFYVPKLKGLKFNEVGPCLQFGKYQLGDHFTNYFSANLDKFFIGKMFGSELLGIYELAYRLMIRPITLINPIFNKVSFPIFSKIQKDQSKLNRWYLRKIELIALILFPMFFGMYALSDQIIAIQYGSGWEATSEAFQIIWFLGMIMCVGNPLGSYLMALGKPEYGFYLNLYRAVLFSIVFYIGGTYFSFQHALMFFVFCAILFTWPLDYYIRHRLTQMKVLDHVSAFIKSMFVSAIMCLIVIAVKQFILTQTSSITIITTVCVSIGVISYTFLTYLLNNKSLSFIRNLISV